MPLFKRFYLTLGAALFAATTSQADEELIQIATEELHNRIAVDSLQRYREFRALEVRNLREIDTIVADELPDVFNEMLQEQVPREVLSSPDAVVHVFQLEPCGLDFAEWGLIPVEGTPLDSDTLYEIVYRIKFNLAFQYDGSSTRISEAGIKSMLNQRMAFNQRLLQAYQSGELPKLYQAIYMAEGCGAGEVSIEIINFDEFQSISYIPEFYFRVCGKRFPDPWSSDDCPFWDTAQFNIAVSGIYRWQGWRHTGQFQSGSFNIVYNPNEVHNRIQLQ